MVYNRKEMDLIWSFMTRKEMGKEKQLLRKERFKQWYYLWWCVLIDLLSNTNTKGSTMTKKDKKQRCTLWKLNTIESN